MSTYLPVQPEVLYPDSDGEPMADNTRQYRIIVTIKGNLDGLFRHDANVFIAGNLFWYAVQGQPKIVVAPDVMAVFGRPKGERGSYMQWLEDGIAPHVVFEVRSPRNSDAEMASKFDFYQRYGVEEYYLIDPDANTTEGWLRRGKRLKPIADMSGWVSPRLKIRFDTTGPEVRVYGPDGTLFRDFDEIIALGEKKERQAKIAKRQAKAARQQADEAKQRIADLEAKLRQLGVDPSA